MTTPGDAELVIVIAAAVIAALIEGLGLASEGHLLRQAKEFVAENSLDVRPELLRDFAAGAVSVSRLAPTAVSVLTAAIAILDTRAPSRWWIYGTVVVLLIIASLFLRNILQRNFYQIATNYVRMLGSFGINVPYTQFYTYCTFGMNALVVLLALYFMLPSDS